MEIHTKIVLAIFLGFILLEIIFTSFFKKPGQRTDDAIVEIFGTISLLFFIQPFVFLLAYSLADYFLPIYKNYINEWSFLSIFGLFLIFEDLTQYWWHRTCHKVPLLYNLHRPHHDPEYLSIRVVFRNNPLYYFMMPGLWVAGILVYLGAGWVYAVYVVIKQTVIFGAHSDFRWDEPLYKIKWLSPIMWVIERTISTPATHSAHHGKFGSDEATHYKGNYGNLLFLWDIIFGTAKITRKYPDRMGVENLPEASASYQLLWPIVRAPKPKLD